MPPNKHEDPVAQAFWTKFAQEYPAWTKHGRVEDDGTLQVEIPAPTGRFTLTIYAADEEITVGAGGFHTHIEGWSRQDNPSPEVIASEALDLVKRIVEERVFFLARQREGGVEDYTPIYRDFGYDLPRTLAFMYRRPGPIRGVSWNGKYDRPFPMSRIRFWFYKLLYFPPAKFARFSLGLRRLLGRPS